MKKYFEDKNSTSIPWTSSPFFYELLNADKNLTEEEKKIAVKFYEDGYCILDLDISDDFIESIRKDIKKNDFKTQEKGYHYSDNPRIFEGWKFSNSIRELANNKKIVSTIEMLYNKTAIPFQTINFLKGSNQPMHSDTIHFHSEPENWVAAAWVALEDMDENNGTLFYCPKSHKLPFYTFKTINLEYAKYGEQFEKYHEYEEFIEAIIKANKLEKKFFIAKKGQVLIWAANLLHGGSPVLDKSRTRFSQATHYYFDGCEKYYSPMFSDAFKNVIAEKNIKDKDIRGILKNN